MTTHSSGDPEHLRTSLIIPCYDEARRLDLDQFHSFLSTNQLVRILFVDDGSRDATRDILMRLSSDYENRAAVLALPYNKGKAEAVRTGIMHAFRTYQPQVVGYWDADLSTPLDAVSRLLTVLNSSGVQMVFGSRVKLLGRHVERLPVRHYLGRVFATAVSLTLQMPIYDSQCGAKLFRADESCEEVFSQPFLSKWIFDVEILARYLNLYNRDSKRLEQVIYEYPLEKWVDVSGSKLRAADFIKAIGDLIRIKLRYLQTVRG